MTASLRDQILNATGDDAKGLRDRALLRLAYDTMRRRSELVDVLIEDLEARTDGSGVILLRFSKTDQEGEGKRLPISKDTMVACHAWLKKSTGKRRTHSEENLAVRHHWQKAGRRQRFKNL